MNNKEWYEPYKSEDGLKYIIPNYKIDRFRQLEEEITQLKSQLARCEEALQFYTEYDSYSRGEFGYYISEDDLSLPKDINNDCGCTPNCRCERIGGKRAREYFAHKEGGK